MPAPAKTAAPGAPTLAGNSSNSVVDGGTTQRPSTAGRPSSTVPAPSTSEVKPVEVDESASQEKAISGLLLLRVVELRDLILPSAATVPIVHSSTKQVDEKKMPYCVIEFDKNQVMVTAKESHVTPNGTAAITWKHRAHL